MTLLDIARVLLLAPVLVSPWLLGTGEPNLNRVLVWPLALSGAVWLVDAVRRRQLSHARTPLVAVFTCAGAALGLVQCVAVWPTDASWSPATARLWGDLLGAEGERAPATLYTADSLRLAAWMAFAALTAAIAPALFNSRRAVRWVLGGLALNGAILAVFLIAQLATWNGRIYWFGPEVDRSLPAYGPFVYHNQAANYLGVCLACLAGWWIVTNDAPNRRRSAVEPSLLGGERWARIVQLACFVAIGAGLIASDSRGGLVATLVASAVCLIARFPRRRIGRGAQLAIGGSLAVGALVVWFAMSEQSAQRYATLVDETRLTEDVRLAHWGDALRTAWGLAPLGGGLGAYRHAVQAFQEAPHAFEFRHAHNQYLETLVEVGPIALALLLAAIGVATRQAWSASRSSRRAAGAIGLAALGVVLFQAVHGLLDFCLYLPANFLPTALVIGLLAGPGVLRREEAAPAVIRSSRVAWRPAIAAGLALLAFPAAWVLQRAGDIDAELVGLVNEQRRGSLPVDRLEARIASLGNAIPSPLIDRGTSRLQDALAHEALGELHVARYRRAARESLAADLGIDTEDPSLTPWTSPTILFRKADEAAASGDVTTLAEVRDQPLVVEHLKPARLAFDSALRCCPMLERASVRRVELAFLDERLTTDPPWLDNLFTAAERAAKMRPDPLYSLGNLALLSGRREAAWRTWATSMRLSTRRQIAIARRSALAVSPEQFIADLLPSDPKRLVAISLNGLTEPAFAVPRAAALAEAQRLLALEGADEAYHLRPGERLALAADCREAMGDRPGAVEALRGALERNPARVETRFRLAELLAAEGRLEEALVEARFCARAKPSVTRYTALARRLARAELAAPADASGKVGG